ncbi:MAG: LysR family transcriptional regulator [Myxococcaceae bacterium]|nr:LysR family transcriptional regulator [Myxococcaceae bacterium]MCI0669425.1 LysR family transcriptional regulator [Myxococcaceae bacterium]
MDLNRIAVFARVVETGSFTAAATALGLRKSTVSRSVSALEAELGIRLIQRTTRRLSLTDAGRAYYERARSALAGLEEAQAAAASLQTEPRGLVRITAAVEGSASLAPIVGAFLLRHPHVRVEALFTSRHVDLVKEGVDLAVRAGVLAESQLLARRLGSSDFGLFAAPSYLERRGRPRRVADLARHDCILYRPEGGTVTWRLSDRRGRGEERVTVHGQLQTDQLLFVQHMLLEGVGIALGPATYFAPLVRSGQLESVLPHHVHRGPAIYVVWPSRAFEPAAVAALRRVLIERLPAALGLSWTG